MGMRSEYHQEDALPRETSSRFEVSPKPITFWQFCSVCTKIYIAHKSAPIHSSSLFTQSFWRWSLINHRNPQEPRGNVDKFTLDALIPAFQAGSIEINAALMMHQ